MVISVSQCKLMGYIGFMYIHHYTAFIKILKFLKFTIDVRVTCLIYQPDLFLMDGISHPVIYDKVFLGRGGGGRIVFDSDPVSIGVAFCLRSYL